MRPRLAPALLVLVALAHPAAADVVHLEGGRQLVGRVIEDGDAIRVEVDGGTLTLPRSRIARIERSELPAEALERRVAELRDGDVAQALELADEARAAGLVDAAGRLLQRAAVWAPDDARVRDGLWHWRVLERRLPPDAAAAERLRAALGEGARVHRSPHWRIAYDGSPESAQERAQALEAVWRAFHRLLRDLDVEPAPLDARLEALLFRDHADWVRATGLPESAVAGLNGLYVGPTGRILLFDPRTAPEADRAQEQIQAAVAALAERVAALDQLEAQLREIRAQVEAFRPTPADRDGARMRGDKLAEIDGRLAGVDAARDVVDRDAAEVEAHRERVRRFWDEETITATMHEACHQIAFATGVCHPAQPTWLHEGLATLFEATSSTSLDPTSRNAARLRDLRTVRDAGRGGDLRRIVGGAAFAGGASPEAYAEVWSLTTFLVLRHPAGLGRLLRARPPDGREAGDPATRGVRAFEEAIGELATVEAEWRRFVERL